MNANNTAKKTINFDELFDTTRTPEQVFEDNKLFLQHESLKVENKELRNEEKDLVADVHGSIADTFLARKRSGVLRKLIFKLIKIVRGERNNNMALCAALKDKDQEIRLINSQLNNEIFLNRRMHLLLSQSDMEISELMEHGSRAMYQHQFDFENGKVPELTLSAAHRENLKILGDDDECKECPNRGKIACIACDLNAINNRH